WAGRSANQASGNRTAASSSTGTHQETPAKLSRARDIRSSLGRGGKSWLGAEGFVIAPHRLGEFLRHRITIDRLEHGGVVAAGNLAIQPLPHLLERREHGGIDHVPARSGAPALKLAPHVFGLRAGLAETLPQ